MDIKKKGFIPQRVISILTILVVWVWPIPAGSQEIGEPIVLSLKDSLTMALDKNLEIQIERFDPLISAVDIILEQSAFDLEWEAELSRGRTTRPTASTVEATIFGQTVIGVDVLPIEESSMGYNLGLHKDLSFGGGLDLAVDLTRSTGVSSVFDPSFGSGLTLGFTQPLLKGFGRATTLAPLRVARNDYLISMEEFEIKVADVVEEVEKAYWDLVLERKNLKVRREALSAAREVLIENQAKFELGIISAIEVLVAESGVASREEDVVVAESEVKNAEDRLRQKMNLPPTEALEEVAIIPSSDPVTKEYEIDIQEVTVKAFSKRPELEQARLEVKNRRTFLEEARRNLLPGVDLVGSAGLEGLGGSYRKGLDELESRDFYRWEVALVLNMPIGNREAKSTYRKRQYQLERAQIEIEKIKQEVLLELKEVIRKVRTDQKRIQSSLKARQLAEKQLEAETERLRAGLTTTRNVLEFQVELAEAQNREMKAIIDYNKSLVELGEVQGTLLQDRQIALSDLVRDTSRSKKGE